MTIINEVICPFIDRFCDTDCLTYESRDHNDGQYNNHHGCYRIDELYNNISIAKIEMHRYDRE